MHAILPFVITPDGRHRRAPARGRAYPIWVLADQGVNSVSNVAATVVVAAAAPGRVFAIFATGQLLLALGQTVMLAAAGDRLLQSASDNRPARYAAGVRFFRRTGVLAAALLVVAAVDGRIAAYVPPAAVAVVTCALDYVRIALVTCGRVSRAFWTDAVFAVLQLGGLVLWSSRGAPGGAAGAWAVWGAAAVVVLTPYALGFVRAFPRHTPERVRDAVSLRYGLEMAAVNGSGQVAQLVASTTIGLTLNAMVRGAQIPFGVVILVLLASRAVLIPLFARPDSRRFVVVVVAGVGGLCVLTGVVTWIASDQSQLRFLVAGQQLDLVFVGLTTALYTAFGIQQVLFYFLRARHDDRAVGMSRYVVVIGFAATAVGAGLLHSVEVFLVGSAVTWALACAVMVWRHDRRTPAATAAIDAPVTPERTAVAA